MNMPFAELYISENTLCLTVDALDDAHLVLFHVDDCGKCLPLEFNQLPLLLYRLNAFLLFFCLIAGHPLM
jgi:hypothetical protein